MLAALRRHNLTIANDRNGSKVAIRLMTGLGGKRTLQLLHQWVSFSRREDDLVVEAEVPTVRTALTADAHSVAAIYADHVAHGTASFDTVPRTDAQTAGKIEECVGNGWPFLVAQVKGKVVGYAYATQFRDRPAYASTCESSIYIDAEHIGQGVGTLLLNALLQASADAGFRQMIAVIGGAEPASMTLHAKAGFVEKGRLQSVGRKFGRWLDTVYMQLSLGAGDSEAPAHEQ